MARSLFLSRHCGLLFFLGLLIPGCLRAQEHFRGPGCLIAGRVAVYRILGPVPGPHSIQVCLSHAPGSSPMDSCWTTGGSSTFQLSCSSKGSYKLRLSGSAGSATLKIQVADPLSGGRIDSTLKVQILLPGKQPLTIRCSDASGGNCSPRYHYQWQQSSDAHLWKDMPRTPDPSLGFAGPLSQTTYFRRKVTETRSGICSYSSIAVVFIDHSAKALKP